MPQEVTDFLELAMAPVVGCLAIAAGAVGYAQEVQGSRYII